MSSCGRVLIYHGEALGLQKITGNDGRHPNQRFCTAEVSLSAMILVLSKVAKFMYFCLKVYIVIRHVVEITGK